MLRMPFGLSSASEVLQQRNYDDLNDIPNVHIIADNLIIAKADSEEHDKTLQQVLQRATEQNIRFSTHEIQYKVDK